MLVPLALLAACTSAPPAPEAPPAEAAPAGPTRLAELRLPVDPAVAAVARDIMDIRVTLAPSIAADVGLFPDAVRVPSFSTAAVAALDERLQADLDALEALPWAELDIDDQLDARWLHASATEARHRLRVERRWRHRPAEWLEPVAGAFTSLATYAPERVDLQVALAAEVPAMVAEMKREVVEPTRRDLEAATGIADGLVTALQGLPEGPERDGAIAALSEWGAGLPAPEGLPEYRVIGPEAYAFRLKHVMLLPWTPDELLALARAEITAIELQLEELEAGIGDPPPPTPEETAEAEGLTKAGLLSLYEDMVAEDLAALRAMDVITVPPDLPPVRARETPDALIPLTGDGGSMNPPPLFGPPAVGWWNVEHFREDWPLEHRLHLVVSTRRHHQTGYGPYAVHEGVPGHHLQLTLVRANRNPIRTVLWDNAAVEGWGLYAEQLFHEHGGMGSSDQARRSVLRSYLFRARRVVYDVNVETGRWTLQEAAEWKARQAGVEVDKDVLRTIQWPTQLIGYFAGKQQLLALREARRAREGQQFSIKRFHDELLAEGLVPVELVRAKWEDGAIAPPSR